MKPSHDEIAGMIRAAGNDVTRELTAERFESVLRGSEAVAQPASRRGVTGMQRHAVLGVAAAVFLAILVIPVVVRTRGVAPGSVTTFTTATTNLTVTSTSEPGAVTTFSDGGPAAASSTQPSSAPPGATSSSAPTTAPAVDALNPGGPGAAGTTTAAPSTVDRSGGPTSAPASPDHQPSTAPPAPAVTEPATTPPTTPAHPTGTRPSGLAPGANVALGRPTTQSSTYAGGVSSRAVDGNRDGEYSAMSVTHTSVDIQPWWQVDLGADLPLGSIAVSNRTDCCSGRLTDAFVFAGERDMTGRTVEELNADPTVRGLTLGTPAQRTTWLDASGTTARFVRVQLAGTGNLSLAEVQIFVDRNLSLGRAATQSSVPAGLDSPATKAVDGMVDGYGMASVSETDTEPQPWWQVDLGQLRHLDAIEIANRTDCCSDRLNGATVFVSNTDMAGRTYAQLMADTTVTKLQLPAVAPASVVLVAGGVTGRFVKVQSPNTTAQRLSLAEVIAWGAATGQ